MELSFSVSAGNHKTPGVKVLYQAKRFAPFIGLWEGHWHLVGSDEGFVHDHGRIMCKRGEWYVCKKDSAEVSGLP